MLPRRSNHAASGSRVSEPESQPNAGDAPRKQTAVKGEESLRSVLLNACGTQPGKTMLVDGILPGEEFFDGQRIAAAGFL